MEIYAYYCTSTRTAVKLVFGIFAANAQLSGPGNRLTTIKLELFGYPNIPGPLLIRRGHRGAGHSQRLERLQGRGGHHSLTLIVHTPLPELVSWYTLPATGLPWGCMETGKHAVWATRFGEATTIWRRSNAYTSVHVATPGPACRRATRFRAVEEALRVHRCNLENLSAHNRLFLPQWLYLPL